MTLPLDYDFNPEEGGAGVAQFEQYGFATTKMRTLDHHIAAWEEEEEDVPLPEFTVGKLYNFTDYMPEYDEFLPCFKVVDDLGNEHLVDASMFKIRAS